MSTAAAFLRSADLGGVLAAAGTGTGTLAASALVAAAFSLLMLMLRVVAVGGTIGCQIGRRSSSL